MRLVARRLPRDRHEPWKSSRGTVDANALVMTTQGAFETSRIETPGARRNQRLLDGLIEGCQIISPEFRYLYLNESALRHAHKPAEELLGRTMGEAYPGIEQTETFRTLERCLRDGTSARFETMFEYPDGRVGWFEVVVHPDPEGLMILSHEVTAQKRIEEGLLGLQRVARMGSFELQRGGTIQWSPELFNVMDREPHEGPTRFDALGPDASSAEWAELQVMIDGVLEGKPAFMREVRRCTQEGIRWLLVHVEGVASQGGRPSAVRGVVQDVTARKIAELDSTRARAEVKAIIDASPVAIVAIDRESNVILWNATASSLFGWTAEEVVGRPLPQIPEGSRGELERGLARARAGERVILPRATRNTRDGRTISVMVSIGPLRGSGGTVIGTVAVLVDLTAEDRLRHQLEAAERRFAAAFATSPVAKLLVRVHDGRVIDANAAFAALSGRTIEDLVGAPAASAVDVVSSAIATGWNDAIRGVGQPNHDVVLRDASGKQRDVHVSAERVILADGDHVMLRLQDMTEEHRRAVALAESEERFRQLTETIEEVFWLTDVDKTGVAYISPGYDLVWGRPGTELATNPRAWLDAIHPDDRDRVRQAMSTKQTNGTYDEEYRIVRPDASVRWIRDRAFPVRDATGKVFRIAGAATDVTERHTLEEQVRQTQKLESIGLLAGGVAHDFNNILTVVASGCQELVERVTDAEGREIVDEIAHAADRATALTRQLLAFSRREVVSPRIVDVDGLVAETERMLRRMVGEDVRLTLSRTPVPAHVYADPGHLTQVLMNLAVNARHAMPKGGTLAIGTSIVDLAQGDPTLRERLPPGRYACLSVRDDGVGMPPEIRARIFEPFFTTRRVGEGTGLGLSVVHGIVARSGGTIEVESALGHGTTFRIYLPLRDATPSNRAPASVDGMARGTETVLVVEDDPSIRRIVIRTLEEAGYHVLVAKDGISGLGVSSRHEQPIDLLLTDVVMPRMDGRALASELQRLRPGLRVLFTSGYAADDVDRWGVREGEVEFLPKPFAATALRAKVREVLDRARRERS
jgi:PAS domain S-box-containing protein